MKKIIIFYIFIFLLSSSYIYANENKIINIGEKYSKLLINSLKKELKHTFKTKGIISAIKVCSEKAQIITNKISKNSDGIIVKRTSFKYRNPLNKPTPDEEKALNYFKTHKKAKFYIEKTEQNGKIFYNYYKKLIITGICLKCHGMPSKMNPELLKILKKLYPYDKAIGYKTGDFRGVIKVSISENLLAR